MLDSGALVLYFPAPQTVTGEDILELHVHGGPAIVKAVLDAIPRCVSSSTTFSLSIRYAEPGEFTRRAFYNNRLDLTQVEALGNALSAETEQQRRLAVRGTTNALSQRYDAWRRLLLSARGELEALIDFSEDHHFEKSPEKLVESVAGQITNLHHEIQMHIQNALRGELLRNGIDIALLGAPNAGKSSLLNRIVGREAAIVSRVEGTTRDVVEVNVDIGGYFCKFGDLAGIRAIGVASSSFGGEISEPFVGEIEAEGILRAKQRILSADVVIVVLAVQRHGTFKGGENAWIGDVVHIQPAVKTVLTKLDYEKQKVVFVVNKSDLLSIEGHDAINWIQSEVGNMLKGAGLPDRWVIPISCRDAEDESSASQLVRRESPGSDPGRIHILLNDLVTVFEEMTSSISSSSHDEVSQTPCPGLEESLGATTRQRLLLISCLDHLMAFLNAVRYSHSSLNVAESPHSKLDSNVDIDIVLAAESLREAATCLARITGRGNEASDVEEVLGVVFEKYVSEHSSAEEAKGPSLHS